jgi:hypothetical protein
MKNLRNFSKKNIVVFFILLNEILKYSLFTIVFLSKKYFYQLSLFYANTFISLNITVERTMILRDFIG